MGATEMGQLAMEYLDDRKFEFNKLEKEIKANMKERERTLKLVRREVAYLTNSFPKLIRKEVRIKRTSNIGNNLHEMEIKTLLSTKWSMVMNLCSV